MSKTLKDHVVVFASSYNLGTGEIEQFESITRYEDVTDPRFLPDVARCEETIDEWAAYHHCQIDGKAQRAKQELEKRRPRRVRVWPSSSVAESARLERTVSAHYKPALRTFWEDTIVPELHIEEQKQP